MKKLFFTFIFLIFITLHLYSQEHDKIKIDPQIVNMLINQEFGNLINPQSKNILGNFASFDPKDPEVNFAGNIIFNDASILGIKVKAQINDGFLPIFSNSELNSNIGLSMQYNFMNFDNVILYNDTLNYYYYNEKKKINYDYDINKIEILMGQKKILGEIEIENLEYSYKSDTAQLMKDKRKYEQDLDTLSKMKDQLDNLTESEVDSLKNEIEKREHLLILSGLEIKKSEINITKDSSELKLKKDKLIFLNSNYELMQAMAIHQLLISRNTKNRKLMSDYKIDGFKFGWFSLGVGINNSSFRLFNPASAYENQISRETFFGYNIRAQYSYYIKSNNNAYQSLYFTLGAAFSNEDNHLSLSTVEINQTKNYGPNPNDRYINSKYNAYKGTYKSDLKTLSFYSDFYYFLFNDNGGAVHFYPDLSMINNFEPVTNLGFGFLLTFKNADDTKNIINSEFYINFLNIFGNNNPAENLWKRSSYGIRFTFPIDFNSKL